METSSADVLDFTKIKQDKVQKLLIENGVSSLVALSKLTSFCYDKTDGNRYFNHCKSFLINAPASKVWNTYKTISPDETRIGKMVSFGLMYSRRSNTITYSGDPYSGLEAGQIIFLNLNLFKNIINLAVGHEITGIDDVNKTIKICYLKNGASMGTQLIQLMEPREGLTQVVHNTWYRSGSFFRDKVLYPFFHTKGLTEYHENVKRKVEETMLMV